MSNKFENRIKEAFDKRTIAPSKNGWDAIENQLGEVEVRKGRGFMWYGIAAGFIGIILLSVFFLKQSEITVAEPMEVVTVPLEKKEQEIESKDLIFPAEGNALVQTAEEDKEPAPVRVEKQTLKKEPINETDVVVANLSTDEEWNNEEIVNDLEEKGIENKIAEVVAMVSTMEETNGLVSDAVIDSMLRQAQKELFAEQIISNGENVDANALLAEVEDELNRSLRDQLFEKLKDGYLKVKTAVAYRNN
ncbi:MAG: hypothetical protein KJN75_02810 [Muriicola sp.]|nr:hypothetical protein [Muriicola sp.]